LLDGGRESGTQGAVAAALAVAQEQGVRCEEAIVLRDAWHVLVHLRPSPVVARVSSPLPYPEGPDPEGIVRELAVASHCARAGCAVVPPAAEVEAVPHYRGGHVLTFWRYIEPADDPDPCTAGRRLREIHEALAGYDGELPAFGHPEETQTMLDALPPSADVQLVREIASRRPDVSGQPLHGDAQLFNCLGSEGGPLWLDFETACHGPREYDLAALGPGKALDAYGPHDAELVDAMFLLYIAWVTASMMIALPRRPELAEAVERRLRQLRER
jgi:Phosphotransferase enzyme family